MSILLKYIKIRDTCVHWLLDLATSPVIALRHFDAFFIALQSKTIAFISSSNVPCTSLYQCHARYLFREWTI